ncbi:hypothetical protein [Streptomyces sp. NRRL F-5123]|uniref:hypothetical protein n=1 Tax=Streptomyces sp. NRRL F-5123 TaxID=1463856 RepID=UPI0004E0B6EF|nr:hypothetical protein [Streptomyces sp. NRRL F-5123]
MITEPELTDGADDEPGEVISGGEEEAPSRRAAGRRAWVWGVCGALVASAVWGVGVRAWQARHDGRPDLHGYALGGSPCTGGTMKPLLTALGTTESAVVTPTDAHLGKAVDTARCTMELYAPDGSGGLDLYQLAVTVDLHKRNDPRGEFEDLAGVDPQTLAPAADVHRVAGLGDEAVAQAMDRSEEIQVLHGGAVFTLTLTWYASGSVSEDTPEAVRGTLQTAASDVGRFEPGLVGAMRNVMKGQQKSGR